MDQAWCMLTRVMLFKCIKNDVTPQWPFMTIRRLAFRVLTRLVTLVCVSWVCSVWFASNSHFVAIPNDSNKYFQKNTSKCSDIWNERYLKLKFYEFQFCNDRVVKWRDRCRRSLAKQALAGLFISRARSGITIYHNHFWPFVSLILSRFRSPGLSVIGSLQR